MVAFASPAVPALSALPLLLLAVLAAVPRYAEALSKLPPYIAACSRSDPKLDECIVTNGKSALPFVIKGDPKYRVPKLNPLVIPELQLQQGSGSVGLKLSWKNAELHGLKDADFRAAKLDVDKHHLKLDFYFPAISIVGTYNASGRVLLLPVTGSGPSNITVERMKLSYDVDWNLIKKGEKEYIDVTKSKMTLHEIGFMSLKFASLFSGDPVLAGSMNRFLNENWKELKNEFGPGVADAIGQVFRLILKNICDIVPYDVVLKP